MKQSSLTIMLIWLVCSPLASLNCLALANDLMTEYSNAQHKINASTGSNRAAAQLNTARCARLALDLQHIREQFRRGYSIRQQVQLEQKQDRLRLALQTQCQPDTENTQTLRTIRPASRDLAKKAPTTAQRPQPAMQISSVRLAAPYQGKQQQAWLAFYQSPFYCYNVRSTVRIRQCVEQRQAAQRQFERQWHLQNLSDQ